MLVLPSTHWADGMIWGWGTDVRRGLFVCDCVLARGILINCGQVEADVFLSLFILFPDF